MKFDLRFITTLVLIVLIIVSFVFLILENLHFSNNAGKLAFQENTGNADIEIDKLTATSVVKVKTLGPSPKKLVADTQYYRYGSLLIHVLALISGAYIVYSG